MRHQAVLRALGEDTMTVGELTHRLYKAGKSRILADVNKALRSLHKAGHVVKGTDKGSVTWKRKGV